jgi:predicted RNA binding protein YcfA (HicA-like mRNA interferase family)
MVPYMIPLLAGGDTNMTKREKRLQRMHNNPHDVNFEDIDRLLLDNGFERHQPSGGSSHYIYRHRELHDKLSIPYNRPVKAIYIKQALAAIESLKERGDK